MKRKYFKDKPRLKSDLMLDFNLCVKWGLLHLQVIEDHLSEHFHRGPLGGLVEGGSLLPGFHLTSQIITRSLLHLALNYSLQVSPAPRVHLKLTNKPWGAAGLITGRLERSVGDIKTDLAFGLGSEALPQVKCAFLTQAAAGWAADDPFFVFVTLKNTMETRWTS